MRSKDPFWKHVEERNRRSVCKYCGEDYAPGNIHRIKVHLARVGGQGIKECTEVPDNVRDEAFKAINNVRKRAKSKSYSTGVLDTRNISSSLAHQQSLPEADDSVMLLKEINDREVNGKLTKFFILNSIASDVVESQSFIDFITCAIGGDRSYKLPGSLELQTKYVPEIEMEVDKYIEGVKKSWEITGCTLMVEKFCNFFNVIIYSHKGAIFVSSYNDINFDINNVVSIIERSGADHVVQFITNSSEILHSAGDMLKAKYPRIYQTGCVAQEIHSLLEVIYDEIHWVRQIIDDAELLIKYLHSDVNVLSSMRNNTNMSELKYPCMAKFASKYQMLQSIIKNKDELEKLVSSQEWRNLGSNGNEIASRATFIIQSSSFWGVGQEVLKMAEPIIQVLRLVEEDKSTSGFLYEAMLRAEEAIKRQNQGKYARILKLFDEKRTNIICPIHAAAAFLNPASMFNEIIQWNSETYESINFLLENLVISREEKGRFLQEMQLYRERSPKVFDTASREIMKSHHPCVWWNHIGPILPVLRKYALRILSQPCKCSLNTKPTAFEVTQTNRMDSRRTWLTMNAIIMERFKTTGEELLARIDIQRCNELPNYSDPKEDWKVDPNANFVDDTELETNPFSLNAKVLADKEILEMLTVYIQSLISNLVKGENVETLENVIAHIQDRISQEVEASNWEMNAMETFSQQEEANTVTLTQVQHRREDRCLVGSSRNDNNVSNFTAVCSGDSINGTNQRQARAALSINVHDDGSGDDHDSTVLFSIDELNNFADSLLRK